MPSKKYRYQTQKEYEIELANLAKKMQINNVGKKKKGLDVEALYEELMYEYIEFLEETGSTKSVN